MRQYTEVEIRAALASAQAPEPLAEQVLASLRNRPGVEAQFEPAHIAYYLGALLIIGAMGWFITSAWDALSGVTLFVIALAYAAVFGAAAAWLRTRPGSHVPAGLLATVAVCMTPLAVYGLERQFHLWPTDTPGEYHDFHPLISGNWVYMEVATLITSALALRWIRFPFVTAPAAYALWYLSMDLTALLFGHGWSFHQECWISIIFGAALLLVAFFADGESDTDLAFWFYLFGLLAFSGGLTLLGDGDQLGKLVYCLLHLGMILVSVLLQRRAFLVFGGLGVFAYLADEATHFFRDSLGFTLALTLLGVLFLVAGLLFKRNEERLFRLLSPWIPARVRHRHDLPQPSQPALLVP